MTSLPLKLLLLLPLPLTHMAYAYCQSTGQWTRVSGGGIPGPPITYGARGVASAGNRSAIPAASVLSNTNPNNIESIPVLKDADATSIYDTQGSNGVILCLVSFRKYVDTCLYPLCSIRYFPS
jgi:TonB-dependent SusC/RagA subfamily outer membrane receptor